MLEDKHNEWSLYRVSSTGSKLINNMDESFLLFKASKMSGHFVKFIIWFKSETVVIHARLASAVIKLYENCHLPN